MKTLGILLLTGALTLGLTACGGTEEAETSKVSEETTTQEETTEASTESETAADVEEFTITATNWEFTSDKELTVKKGTKVKINLVNEEGMHTIGSEDLGFDLNANEPVEFTADTAGEFELICSTICGAMDDHEAMTISFNVTE
jgi:cytochrome c oxidase subunit II